MQYEFQNTLHHSRHDMLYAIAYEWMTACGDNDADTVSLFCGQTTPVALAAECVEGWGLDDEWLAARDSSQDDLVAAFRDFCRDRPDRK